MNLESKNGSHLHYVDMKIVTFCNSRYKHIALNWISYLQSHKIYNYKIYALDQETFNFLNSLEVDTELIEVDIFNKDKWSSILRFNYVLKLLKDGINVLHSDLDAIWLKNPLEFISHDYDIVSSTGKYPQNINERNGFTLCMGWIYYKSCDIVKDLIKNTIRNYPLNPNQSNNSDQFALNNELFSPKNQSNIFSEKYSNLKLKTLDQNIISRYNPHNCDTYVAHPYTAKRADREMFLKNEKLWNNDKSQI